MYFNNAGWFLSALYPSLIWKKKVDEKVLFLTFDDGPIPEITEYVLEELKRYSVPATFFCVGDNVRKYSNVFSKIVNNGHVIGNHTFNHLKGWKTSDEDYIENINECDKIIFSNINNKSECIFSKGLNKKLFRPPYGLIKKSQIRKIKDDYEIVMWDVLTGDFNRDLSPENCLNKALKYTQKGSIVIFHDSIKAEPNLKYALPRFIEHFLSLGYRFETL